jgi:imidazolonepropionase-like amidohydrolase
MQYLFRNATVLDPEADEPLLGHELLVEDGTIREIAEGAIRAPDAVTIDCAGATLIPGLIDCHVHVVLSEVFIPKLEAVPLTLMTAKAVRLLGQMLDRGFTTVRDTGGADWGLKAAVDQGIIAGPRLFIAGKAIGPTGGHSDPRRRTDAGQRCHCCNAMAFTMGLADGTAEVRKSVREEMRQGCDQVKIMMSGALPRPTTRSSPCSSRKGRSAPRSRRRMPSDAMSAPMPTRPRRSSGRRIALCAPSSTAN